MRLSFIVWTLWALAGSAMGQSWLVLDMGQKLQALIQEVAMTTEAAAGPGACGGC